MKKLKTKLTCLSLVMAIIIGTMTAPAINPAKTEAAEKAYGAKLKLNNGIKLNTTKTFKKKGFTQWKYIGPKKTIKTNYTIKCSRKEVGDKYKVTYNVNYKYLNDYKMPKKIKGKYSDIYKDVPKNFIAPIEFCTVFDYKTGKNLEISNKLGVKVNRSEWKYKFYPAQTVSFSKDGDIDGFRFKKSASVSFTVTYPKKYKDIVVGIGFISINSKEGNNKTNTQYCDGKVPYGKTSFYKKGKKTVSYMRLNK